MIDIEQVETDSLIVIEGWCNKQLYHSKQPRTTPQTEWLATLQTGGDDDDDDDVTTDLATQLVGK